VFETGADLGIALDGDADRVILADEKGQLIDGDKTMGLIATQWQRDGLLRGDGIVATVMSNMGLEKYLSKIGINLHRAQVGDRYVIEEMRNSGCNIGGEQSGHIILSDHGSTGDGLIAALQVLSALVRADRPASEIAGLFDPFPQMLRNIPFNGGAPLEENSVIEAIRAGEERLGDKGRLLIRKSGTEPLIRVMAEAEDAELMAGIVDDISGAIEGVTASGG